MGPNLTTLHLAKKKVPSLPRLIVFDLDGCLWSPELFELLTSENGKGSPFTSTKFDNTNIPGTLLKSSGGETMRLLGDTRKILHRLYYEEAWFPTMVGISSRTDRPDWAEELLDKFTIYDQASLEELPQFSMRDVFTPELCILDKSIEKDQQFHSLKQRANNLLSQTGSIQATPKKLRFQDILFFDNEAGNCTAVAKLGVTVVYCPSGLDDKVWEEGLKHFPSTKVLGSIMPY